MNVKIFRKKILWHSKDRNFPETMETYYASIHLLTTVELDTES